MFLWYCFYAALTPLFRTKKTICRPWVMRWHPLNFVEWLLFFGTENGEGQKVLSSIYLNPLVLPASFSRKTKQIKKCYPVVDASTANTIGLSPNQLCVVPCAGASPGHLIWLFSIQFIIYSNQFLCIWFILILAYNWFERLIYSICNCRT